MTDALRAVVENTARFNGGMVMTGRYDDLIKPPEKNPKTADEVIVSISNKLANL